jgi:hypothetical protein
VDQGGDRLRIVVRHAAPQPAGAGEWLERGHHHEEDVTLDGEQVRGAPSRFACAEGSVARSGPAHDARWTGAG